MKVDDDVSRTKYALTTQQIKGNEEIPGTKKKKPIKKGTSSVM